MKKIALYSMLAVTGLLFTACNDDYKDWSEPQGYAQADAENVVFQAASMGEIDLTTVTDETIQIFNPTITASEGATTTYDVAIYNDEKTDSVVIKATDGGMAKRAEVQGALVALYGAEEVQHEAPMNVTAYTLIDGTAVANQVTGLKLTAKPKKQELPPVWYILGTDVGLGTWVNSKRTGIYTSLVAMYPNPYNYDELVYASYFSDGSEFKIIVEAGNKDTYIGGGDENGGQMFQSEKPEGSPLGNVVVGKGGYYKVIVNVADIKNPTLSMEPISGDVKLFSEMNLAGKNIKLGKVTTAGKGENHDWYSTNVTFDSDATNSDVLFQGTYDGGEASISGAAFPLGKAFKGTKGIPYKAGTYDLVFNDLLNIYYFIKK